MRRRRTTEASSSLDLLLDTMTNAFGGVLFLAILLSIQLKDRSVISADLPDFESKITRLELQRDELLTQISNQMQQKEHSEKFRTEYSSDVRALDRLQDANKKSSELGSRERELAGRIEQIREEQTESAKRVDTMTQKRDSVDDELVRLRSELKSEQEKRTISGRLPRRKLSTKIPVGLLLKNGRVYQIYKDGEYNLNDVIVEDDDWKTTLRPKPGGGVPVSNSTGFGRTISRMIEGDPKTHHVTVAVWDDSFDQFQTIKRHIIDGGFDYRIIMLPGDAPLGVGGGISYTQ